MISKALFKITRPLNVLITMISVWVAALLAKDFTAIDPLIVSLGALAAGLIAAAGNIHNDVCDLDIDRINRPRRPLPRGEISPLRAVVFAGIFGLGGIVIGAALGIIPYLITLVAATLLYVYNKYLKMTPLWGNITVSLLTALAFIFGAFLAGRIEGGLIPAVFSLFFHFSREMVKDTEDYTGDSARIGSTFAQKYGRKSASMTAIAVLIILIIIIPLPFIAQFYNIYYLIVSTIGVILPLIWVIYALFQGKVEKLRLVSNILKLGMVMGLAALFAGK